MNNARRKQLKAIATELKALHDRLQEVAAIDSQREQLESVKEGEDEAFNNLSENLQNGERGEQMQQHVSDMEEAISLLEDFSNEMESTLESLTECADKLEEIAGE